MQLQFLRLAGIAALVLTSSAAWAQAPQAGQSDAVTLDYLRYEGRYYEIARLPNFKERDCTADVVTTFLRRTDGDVSVIYQCIEDDKSWIMDIGRLSLTTGGMGTGEVYFTGDLIGLSPWYYGTYHLLELAGDYSYAMLGDPDRSRLWILSRTRQMNAELYNRLVARAAERGYDTSQLVRSVQNGL